MPKIAQCHNWRKRLGHLQSPDLCPKTHQLFRVVGGCCAMRAKTVKL